MSEETGDRSCCISITVPSYAIGSYSSTVITGLASTSKEVVEHITSTTTTAIGLCEPTWDINTTYEPGDVVSLDGSFWRCLQTTNTTRPEPEDDIFWEEIADPCTETKVVSITVPSYNITTTTVSTDLDIEVPSCEIPIYSYELSSDAYVESCVYPTYSLETSNTSLDFSAQIAIPVYSTTTANSSFNYTIPKFKEKVIAFPTYTQSCTSVSLKSYADAYYLEESRSSRSLVPCTPGGYTNQPPAPTWTNTGRARMYLEVALRKGVSDLYEQKNKSPMPDGWAIEKPECELVIYLRDYNTGEVLEELDNSIEFWAWVTAKDAENTFNDKYEPFGNILRQDPRWEQNPVELIKANIRIERHHQLENVRYVDTPLQSGHLCFPQLKDEVPAYKLSH